MKYENIIWEKQEGIGTITLNRPKFHNALCRAVNNELEDVLAAVDSDAELRVLILTGGDKVFAAGADIAEMADAFPIEAEKASAQAHRINDVLESLPVPVIAAVNGLALGGGFELALACDFRVVAADAVLGLPEVGLGILPGAGGTQRLARLAGSAFAKEVILLGRRISGKEAFAKGIATTAVPAESVMTEALHLAQKLREKPAAALRFAKSAINEGARLGSDSAKLIERLLFALSFSTDDQKEGMAAFQQKRAPQYKHSR